MLYFAYGSNLSSIRLRERVPSSKLVGTGKILGHKLIFHKIGRDGSAKCDAYCTGQSGDYVLGAVYRIDPTHKILLDKAEGLGNGYEIKHLDVLLINGKKIKTFLYTATLIDRSIKPFHWYKEHVLQGMREHGFPSHYCSCAETVQSIADHDSLRAEIEMKIYTDNKEGNFSIGGEF